MVAIDRGSQRTRRLTNVETQIRIYTRSVSRCFVEAETVPDTSAHLVRFRSSERSMPVIVNHCQALVAAGPLSRPDI